MIHVKSYHRKANSVKSHTRNAPIRTKKSAISTKKSNAKTKTKTKKSKKNDDDDNRPITMDD